MRGRPDVGLGDVCISDSLSGYHNTDTLTLERTIAKLSAKFAASGSGAVSEWSGGALNHASEPILRTVKLAKAECGTSNLVGTCRKCACPTLPTDRPGPSRNLLAPRTNTRYYRASFVSAGLLNGAIEFLSLRLSQAP